MSFVSDPYDDDQYDDEDASSEERYGYSEDPDPELACLQNEALADVISKTQGDASRYIDCPRCGRRLLRPASVCGHCHHRFGWLSWIFG